MIAENRNQDAVERDVDCGANHGCHHGIFALEPQHVHTCEEGGQQAERRAQRQNRNIAPGNKEVLADHKRHDNLRNHNQTRASDKRNGRIRAEHLAEKCNLLFRVALLDRRNLPGIRKQIGNHKQNIRNLCRRCVQTVCLRVDKQNDHIPVRHVDNPLADRLRNQRQRIFAHALGQTAIHFPAHRRNQIFVLLCQHKHQQTGKNVRKDIRHQIAHDAEMRQQNNVQNNIEERIDDAVCRIHFVVAHTQRKLCAQRAQAGRQNKRQNRNGVAGHKVHEQRQNRRDDSQADKAHQYGIKSAAEYAALVGSLFQAEADDRVVDAHRGNRNHQLTDIDERIDGTILTRRQDVGIVRQHEEHEHLGGKCADGKNQGVAHQLFVSVLCHRILPYSICDWNSMIISQATPKRKKRDCSDSMRSKQSPFGFIDYRSIKPAR